MKFKVFAKTMFCGVLTVTSSGLHIFRDRSGKLSDVDRVHNYSSLRLVKI